MASEGTGPRLFCVPRLRAATRGAATTATPPPPLDRPGVEFYLRAATALWHGLPLLRTRPGRTILVPAYHCGLDVDVLVRAGYRIAFYPVGRDLAIDIGALVRLTQPEIGALYVIHYFGVPQPVAALRALCVARGWELIEDCAQALFARSGGHPVGTFGEIAIFSFNKAVPLPLGGALLVNDPALGRATPATVDAPRMLVARTMFDVVGRSLEHIRFFNLPVNRELMPRLARGARSALGPRHDDQRPGEPGSAIEFREAWRNLRMPRLCHHLLRRANAEDVLRRRRGNFEALLAASRDCRNVTPLLRALPDGACPGFFPVVASGGAERLVAHCRARGVQAQRFWASVHPAFPVAEFPDVAWLKREVVVLPVHQDLEPGDIARLQAVMATA